MRILIFTGKGGVGKTTVAASTAVRAARAGVRTLVMSTDPAHSLADAFDVPLGSNPTEVAPNLWGQQIDAQERLEEGWREIQEYVLGIMEWGGVDAISAEELSVIPGLDELFSLTDVKRASDDGSYDLLVVDCAPTAETLRLLSLPDVLNWYFERIFPIERKVAKVVRPGLQPGDRPAHRQRSGLQRDRADAPHPRGRSRPADRPEDEHRPARDERREDGDRRGPPHLHLPQPVRLPGRRGGLQPAAARRGPRSLLREMEGCPERAPRNDPRIVLAGAGPHRPAVRPRDDRREAARQARERPLREAGSDLDPLQGRARARAQERGRVRAVDAPCVHRQGRAGSDAEGRRHPRQGRSVPAKPHAPDRAVAARDRGRGVRGRAAQHHVRAPRAARRRGREQSRPRRAGRREGEPDAGEEEAGGEEARRPSASRRRVDRPSGRRRAEAHARARLPRNRCTTTRRSGTFHPRRRSCRGCRRSASSARSACRCTRCSRAGPRRCSI